MVLVRYAGRASAATSRGSNFWQALSGNAASRIAVSTLMRFEFAIILSHRRFRMVAERRRLTPLTKLFVFDRQVAPGEMSGFALVNLVSVIQT